MNFADASTISSGLERLVRFDEQDFRSRPSLLKLHQFLRASSTESVNRLVFIADHEKVSIFLCQEGDDFVLDFTRILRLIHADMLIFLLIRIENMRLTDKDLIRHYKLVVKSISCLSFMAA